MSDNSLLILGAGGHAHVVKEIAAYNKSEAGILNKVSFLDDGESKEGEGPLSLCAEKDFRKKFKYAFVGIGDATTRLLWLKKLIELGYHCPVLIHQDAWVSPSSKINIGTVIMPNSVVMANSKIGLGCIINTSSSIDHDCIIERGVHIAPGCNLAGNIIIKEKTMIGIGSNIIQGLKIGSNVMVGAGSTVIKDIEPNQLVAGSPASTIIKD